MPELTEQKELAEKLKILDKDIKILWRRTGVVSLIDGLITIPVTKDIDESVRHFLMEYSALFGFKKDLSDLKFIAKTYGIDTHHIKYQQFYEGIPVLYAFVSIHLNSESKIIMIKNNYQPSIELDTKAVLNEGLAKEKAIEIAHEYLNAETRLKSESVADVTILPIEDQFYLSWEVSVSLKNPIESYHIYIDVRNGDVIKKIGVRRKTTGKGKVFNPNPVVALKNENLTPESEIPEDGYLTVVLNGLDGSGFLRGEYVDTGDTQNRVYEPSHLFYYKRGDSRFCEVMAYYHIDSCQRFIQELGFKNICNKQIKVNAYAEGVGNSYFDPDSKAITYGSSGIPDAEDGDIIIHEYGHAIQDDQVSNFGMTDEGCAISEGFGDFLAACFFSEEKGGFNRESVGDWNGIGTVLHCIRRVDNQKYYPENFLDVGRCDADGEIWSAALWDMYLALGGNSDDKDIRIKARERSIKLILQSHFFLTPLSKFTDGAEAIVTANKHLYKGKDDEKIRGVFIKRGFF